jgi:hypothetical protein
MEKRKQLLGEDHPDTLSSMANLAATYRNQGRWKDAEVLEGGRIGEAEAAARRKSSGHSRKHGKSCSYAYSYQGRWMQRVIDDMSCP